MTKIVGLMLSSALIATSLMAQTDLEKLKAEVETLKQQSDILAEELLDIANGSFTKADPLKTHSGLGAAASKVYFTTSPLSIGGYGEMFMAKTNGKKAYGDIYRFIPYFGYKFSDKVILNAEIEIEHGDTALSGTGEYTNGGKILMEFMYLDFLLSDALNIRVGNLLVPMGMINLRHEPTLFATAIRPTVERQLIPSTWHENGVLVYGDIGDSGFDYSIGIVNALNVNNGDNNNSKWIRNGRIGSQYNGAFRPAFTAKVDYTGINGLLVGGSFYVGDGSNARVKEDEISGTTMSIVEAHAQYDYQGLSLKALYAQANLSGAEKFANDAVEEARGFYVAASYDIGGVIGTGFKIPIFAQYENYNLVEQRADGTSDESTNKYNMGVNFFPTPQTVLKVDYEIIDDKNKSEKKKTTYLSLGFLF